MVGHFLIIGMVNFLLVIPVFTKNSMFIIKQMTGKNHQTKIWCFFLVGGPPCDSPGLEQEKNGALKQGIYWVKCNAPPCRL